VEPPASLLTYSLNVRLAYIQPKEERTFNAKVFLLLLASLFVLMLFAVIAYGCYMRYSSVGKGARFTDESEVNYTPALDVDCPSVAIDRKLYSRL
jgi:hypothetical protein